MGLEYLVLADAVLEHLRELRLQRRQRRLPPHTHDVSILKLSGHKVYCTNA